MTVKNVKVQASNRDRERVVYSVNIPTLFSKELSLRAGQVLEVGAILKRSGEFRIIMEGKVEENG